MEKKKGVGGLLCCKSKHGVSIFFLFRKLAEEVQ